MEETEALLIFQHAPGLGPIRTRMLIEHFGSAQAALEAPAKEISLIAPSDTNKYSNAIAKSLKEKDWKRDLELIERKKIKLITYRDPAYPPSLLQLSDFPILLYVMGDLIQEDQHAVGVIGTRTCSLYGQSMAKQIAREMAEGGFGRKCRHCFSSSFFLFPRNTSFSLLQAFFCSFLVG